MKAGARQERTLFYQKHLYERVLPFWLQNGVDSDYGGYFTCFSNYGDELVSTDKYVWSQGRMVWLFATLAEMDAAPEEYLALAQSGYAFLRDHCFLPSGHCAFLLTRDGTPKEASPGQGYETSTYADCFVVLGFAKYALVSQDQGALELALRLFDSILARYRRGQFRTDPEPLPEGYSAHGIPMILLNVSQELLSAAEALAHPSAGELVNWCDHFAGDIMERFIGPDGTIRELLPETKNKDNCILGRYVNPGHSLEDMWFLMHYALTLGKEREKEIIDLACSVVERAFELGWDKEFGGLYHFVDEKGGRPSGEVGKFANHPLTKKLLGGWSDKLWWVHSEAVYVTLLGYELTGKDGLKRLYDQVHAYTFDTFPHPDPALGEWIQIRDRQGQPMDKVVALPVKDPFHITRNLLFLIELLRGVGRW
ncbi:MAG: AGE family epimerase/isomerase [Bacillota bacterium]|jgi:N-acylglucosamine 2-epimerase|nr:AGE family epimerase/isomerase [Bacillota bacterium]